MKRQLVVALLIVSVISSCYGRKGDGVRKSIKTWTLHAESNALFCGDIFFQNELKGDLYVVAVKEPDAPNLPRTVLNYKKIEKGTFYGFLVPVGSVSVFAFQDRNGNKKYDDDELFGTYKGGEPVFLDNGRMLFRVDITLDNVQNMPEKFRKMSIVNDVKSDYVVKKPFPGTVVKMDHYYFDPGFGALGMWRPLELASLQGPSVFMLKEFDPDKIPILFVHGISGTPFDWKFISENIDTEKYLPMVFQYPSGFRLDGVAAALDYEISVISEKYGMKEIIIVAHSMGGLVSRTFIQRYHNQKENFLVRKFISISSPYGGHDLAAYGVRKETKSFVPVWIDMVPGSDFQKRMFETPLNVPFYLFYGNKPKDGEKNSDSDGTVSVKSMLDENVTKDAVEIFQFHEDHTSILNSEEVFKKLIEVIEN
ncbi:MAG TPA: alpha/beta hydrolase [bacterium]|nr:alpha/beta hydrolase [bacterium]